jgi:hypothetical protein
MTRYKRAVLAAVAAVALCIALPAFTVAHSSPSKTETLRVFDKPVAITLTESNGTVTRRPPYPQAKPGDRLDVYSVDYAGNHREHASHWTMSTHLRCSFATGQPDCEAQVATGDSLLVFDGNKLEGGTGRYLGATGRVLSIKEVGDDASDVVAVIHRH